MPNLRTSFTESDVSWDKLERGPTIRSVPSLEGTPSLTFDPKPQLPSSPEADREAILRALYDDRMELINLDALGKLPGSDRVRLVDLEREIDKWEAPDRTFSADHMWRELEETAAMALELRTRIQAKKSGR
jgi:hypothetical protein